jgi:cell wall-associated NlpC family hydrolase
MTSSFTFVSKLPARLYADLLFKPYVEGGRGPDSYDCLGLVLEVQRRLGRALPAYESTIDEFKRHYRAIAPGHGVLGPSFEIPTPVPGCGVLFRMGWNQRHMGVMISRYEMLHTLADRAGGSGIERITAPDWRNIIIGYYLPESCREEWVQCYS